MTIDKQINILWKAINKQGKYIEELEKELDTKNDIINNYSLKK